MNSRQPARAIENVKWLGVHLWYRIFNGISMCNIFV